MRTGTNTESDRPRSGSATSAPSSGGATETAAVERSAPVTLRSSQRAGARRSPTSARTRRPAPRPDQWRKTALAAVDVSSEDVAVKRVNDHWPAPSSTPTYTNINAATIAAGDFE